MLIDNINLLLNSLQEYYQKEYNNIQLEEIKLFLKEKNFNGFACDSLYHNLTGEYSYLPDKAKIKKLIELKQIKNVDDKDIAIRQAPYKQIERWKDKPTDWIIKCCLWLRNEQNKRQLINREISFLYCWEKILDISPDFRNYAKDLIIAGKEKEFKSLPLVDHKNEIQYKEDRNYYLSNIQDILKDIQI
jgi:hypothetical protein